MDDRLTRIFSDVFDIDAALITPDASPDTIDDWDSLSHINMVLAIEGEFGIKFTMTEVAQLTRYDKIMALITEHGGDV